jgi:hypothetical protein
MVVKLKIWDPKYVNFLQFRGVPPPFWERAPPFRNFWIRHWYLPLTYLYSVSHICIQQMYFLGKVLQTIPGVLTMWHWFGIYIGRWNFYMYIFVYIVCVFTITRPLHTDTTKSDLVTTKSDLVTTKSDLVTTKSDLVTYLLCDVIRVLCDVIRVPQCFTNTFRRPYQWVWTYTVQENTICYDPPSIIGTCIKRLETQNRLKEKESLWGPFQ